MGAYQYCCNDSGEQDLPKVNNLEACWSVDLDGVRPIPRCHSAGVNLGGWKADAKMIDNSALDGYPLREN